MHVDDQYFKIFDSTFCCEVTILQVITKKIKRCKQRPERIENFMRIPKWGLVLKSLHK